MAYHYITPGRSNLPSLLLTFFLCLGTYRTVAQTVTEVQTVSVTENSFTVSWTSPGVENITDYRVIVNNGTDIMNTTITNVTYTATGLLPGITYKITIYTIYDNGTSSNGTSHNVTTLPSSVSGFHVTAVWTKQMNLSWTIPSDNNAATYTYLIVRRPDTNSSSNSSFQLQTGLSPGTNYSFVIYTVTQNGVRSHAFEETTNTTMPSPVKNLKVTSVSDNFVNLEWNFSSDPNSNLYTYTVDHGGSTEQTDIKGNTTKINKLSAGTNYSFTVFAVTPNGVHSEPSNVAYTTTQPSPVEDLMVSSVSNSSVNLEWMLSFDNNSKSYTYTVDIVGVRNVTGIEKNTTKIDMLDAGTYYEFTVYAVTANGIYSKSSNVTNATTQPNIVQGVTVSSESETTVTLQWNDSKDKNHSTYTYTVKGEGRNFTKILNIKNNTVVVQNLLPGEDYNLTVFAVTENGVYSLPSKTVSVTTRPSRVSTFQVSGKSNDSVSLKWTSPTDFNQDSYTYIVKVDNNTYPGTGNDYMEVKNLSAGVTYNFSIYTETKNGVRSLKYRSIIDTTMPNAPRNLQGNAVSVSEIYINWTSPGDVNEQLYDYQVIWEDTRAPQNNATNTTKYTNFSIPNLLPGHLYRITAISVIKNTKSINAETYAATKPLSVTDLNVNNISNTSATLTWSMPHNPDSIVTGFQVTVYLNGDKTFDRQVNETMCVVNDLFPGSIYTFSVESFARNQIPGIVNRIDRVDDDSMSYSTPSIIKAETVPDGVKDLKCSKVDAYQISVSFQCPYGNYSTFNVLVNSGLGQNGTKCPNVVIIPNLNPASSYKISVMTIATEKSVTTDVINCETDSTGVIVGSIFGVLLFLLLIALIVFFVLRKRRSKGGSENIPNTTFRPKRFHTIPRDKFKQHYENNHADSDFGFAEEYQELSSVGTTQSKRTAELPENRGKNRFTNVLPYDHTRVKLSIMNGISTSDYINANYMPGYNSTKEFIASQGPLPNTTADFWRMVWEHQVNTIVMLTNCMENGRVKCEHYWPLDYTPCTYGDITVTVTSETILSEWTIRDFSVKHANQLGIKYARHFHFTAWPDHGVPDSTSSIMQFRNLVREHMDQQKSNGPTVVHCSAGVGRTGTLIALDYLIQQIEKEQRLGIYGFVEKMRIHRNLMVQTEAQYIFLNKCMLDMINQPMEDHIYENHTGNELVYENVNAIRNLQRENA